MNKLWVFYHKNGDAGYRSPYLNIASVQCYLCTTSPYKKWRWEVSIPRPGKASADQSP